MRRVRWIPAIGLGAVLIAGGGVAYATTADAGSPPAPCSTHVSGASSHLRVIDGSMQACQRVVDRLIDGAR